MPKYQVMVTRDVTETAVFYVEADNEDAADEKALKITKEGEGKFEIDLCNAKPYVTGCEEVK
jgi:hypothetical protein